MTFKQTQNLWPEKTAAIVSDEKGLHFICRELLRQHSWQAISAPNDLHQLIKLRHDNKISCIIVVDSPSQPATETLRIIFKDSRARLTPTIVVCENISSADSIIYEKVFQVFICSKPLTSASFNQAFRRLISQWSQPAFCALRRVADVPDEKNLSQKIDILDKLLTNQLSMPVALCALIPLMITAGRYKEAEQKLLDQCRVHSQNPAMLAYCAWFYLSMHMPGQASKLLLKLKAVAPTSVLLNPDIASAHLALGEVTRAFDAVLEWHRRTPGNVVAEEFLAKLLVADGRAQHFDAYGISKSVILKLQQQWASAETQTFTFKQTNNQGERTAS